MAIQGFFTGDVKIRDLNGVLKAVNGIVEVATDAGTVTSVGIQLGSTGTDANVANSPITSSGNITLNLPTASATNRGLLSSADWSTFNSKQNALGYTPANAATTLTINGTTYDLSANRSWSVGTHTGALTANFVPKATGSTTLTDSLIYDNGSGIGINTTSPYDSSNFKLDVNGGLLIKNTSGTLAQLILINSNPATGGNNGFVQFTAGGNTATAFAELQSYYGLSIASGALRLQPSGGQVLIGTSTTSVFKVDINGTLRVSGQLTLGSTITNGTYTYTLPGATGTLALTSDIPIVTGYVPYSGATANVDLGEFGISSGYFQADLTPSGALQVGRMQWNSSDGTMDLRLMGNNVTLQIGQEQVARVVNGTGGNLLESNYQAVKIIGAQGQRLQVGLARADNDANSKDTLGLVTENINNNQEGFITVSGLVNEINTTGSLQGETWADGDTLYLSGTTSGRITNIKPTAPIHTVIVGFVVYAHANHGKIYVKVDNGYELEELHDVAPTPYVNKGVLYRDTATNLWKSATIGTLLGYTPISLTSLSASAPLSYNNTTGAFSISQATTSTDGYLSSTDWNTFNNKQAAGSYITALTGEATASGPGSATVTLSTSAVTGKLLTGLNLTGGGTIAATDSILQAFGKVQNQISGMVGGVIFQGTWDASTNTPTLTSSVGTKGYYYIVSVAGSTNLNGITDWKIGDWAIFNGTTWDKVDNTDAVSSVNGFTGAVSLTTSNIAEGTNLYYLDSRARLALSFTAGSGAYDNTTGVITIPTNTSQLTNGANFITLSSLSASSPLAYNNGTGAFSIQVATGSQNGYLSSTDWTTFNSKQNALTLTTTGSSGSSTLVGATLNVPTYTLSGLGGVPTTRQLTINGTAYDLSADRSWSVGTHTGTLTSGFIPKATGATTLTDSLAYDGGSSIGINTNAPHDSTQFKLDVNGGLIVKNASGTTAQFIIINANPATGGNNAFVQHTVGGTDTSSWAQIQTYYGLAVAAGALRLQPNTGQILVGTTTASAFKVDISGTLRVSGQLTLGSTITNGTYTYTLPSATGTLALTSDIQTGYVPYTGATTSLNLGANNITARNYLSDGDGSTTGGYFAFKQYNSSNSGAQGYTSIYALGQTSLYLRYSQTDLTARNVDLSAALLGTTTRQYLFPDKNGTFAMTSDIPANPVGGTGTTNYLPKFTGASTIGNSQIFDNGSTVFVNTTTAPGLNAPKLIIKMASALSYEGIIVASSSNNNIIAIAHTGTQGIITTNWGSGGATTPLAFGTSGAAQMTLDTSGNLGLGVTPTNGTGDVKHIEISSGGRFVAAGNNGEVGTNYYYDSAYKYITTNAVTRLEMNGGAFKFYNAISGSANANITFTQAMTLTASGRLGIGTTAPDTKLDVVGTHRIQLRTDDTIAEIRCITPNGAAFEELGLNGLDLRFYTSSTERMRITSGGNLLIGTTVNYSRLTVSNGNSTRSGITISDANTASLMMFAGASSDAVIAIDTNNLVFKTGATVGQDNGTERMRITSGGEVYIAGTTDQGAYNLQVNGTGVWGAGAYVNGSDFRLKENISDLDNSLELINKMKPVTYNYKGSYSKDSSTQTGFIAQDLKELLKDKKYLDGIVKQGPEYMSVAYQNLIPLLVKGMQEQQKEINDLKSQLNK